MPCKHVYGFLPSEPSVDTLPTRTGPRFLRARDLLTSTEAPGVNTRASLALSTCQQILLQETASRTFVHTRGCPRG
jgi:hypothetical protein